MWGGDPRPSTDWLRPIHIREASCFTSLLIQMLISSRITRKDFWLNIWELCAWPSQPEHEINHMSISCQLGTHMHFLNPGLNCQVRTRTRSQPPNMIHYPADNQKCTSPLPSEGHVLLGCLRFSLIRGNLIGNMCILHKRIREGRKLICA